MIGRPKELLLITLNHLDSIAMYALDFEDCTAQIESCYEKISKVSSFFSHVISQPSLTIYRFLKMKLILNYR